MLFESCDINEDRWVTIKGTHVEVNIWSDAQGVKRNIKHSSPRINIIYQDGFTVSVSIEREPKVLAVSSKLQSKRESSPEWKAIKDGISYVGRNYDLFLKHYNDTDCSFDDEDLFNALRDRGEYK